MRNIFKKRALFSFLVAMSFSIKAEFTRSDYYTKFKDTLLIIHYNHAHYSSMPFLTQLYAPFFKNIVFYGGEPAACLNAIYTHQGYMLSRVVEDVLVTYPDYIGYLFLQDDCVLNIWNIADFSLDKVWLPFATGDLKVPQPYHTRPNSVAHIVTGEFTHGWRWWPTQWGLQPLRKAWPHLTEHDRQNLTLSLGADTALGSMCDMFYIPARLKDGALRISRLFKNIFCEIAISTMLCALEPLQEWQGASMVVDCGHFTESMFAENWPVNFTCVHPLKFSRANYAAYTARIFNTMLPV